LFFSKQHPACGQWNEVPPTGGLQVKSHLFKALLSAFAAVPSPVSGSPPHPAAPRARSTATKEKVRRRIMGSPFEQEAERKAAPADSATSAAHPYRRRRTKSVARSLYALRDAREQGLKRANGATTARHPGPRVPGAARTSGSTNSSAVLARGLAYPRTKARRNAFTSMNPDEDPISCTDARGRGMAATASISSRPTLRWRVREHSMARPGPSPVRPLLAQVNPAPGSARWSWASTGRHQTGGSHVQGSTIARGSLPADGIRLWRPDRR